MFVNIDNCECFTAFANTTRDKTDRIKGVEAAHLVHPCDEFIELFRDALVGTALTISAQMTANLR